jgi:peptidoglycan/xylan/chitin deacetylase (PgdA/CDA1 family)
MRASEIASLSEREGKVIGAHSCRHLVLPRQPIEVQEVEVEKSRRDLEALLGRRVAAFAYPFGAVTDRTREVVLASFDLALTCENALLTAGSDLWRVPRLEVRRERSAMFDEWLHGWLPVD